MSKINWTEEMIGFLKERFPKESNASIAESLGICRRCVAVKARELGLEKNTRQNRTDAVRTIIENYCEKQPERWLKTGKEDSFLKKSL